MTLEQLHWQAKEEMIHCLRMAESYRRMAEALQQAVIQAAQAIHEREQFDARLHGRQRC